MSSGARILVPLEDYVGRAAYYVGDLDRKISEVIRRIVRPGDRVIDIGANLGVITLYLAKLVGQNGVVHSFEPNPSIRDLLNRSIERNGMTQVTVHGCALGSQDGGTLTLSFPVQNAGKGTVGGTRTEEGWTAVQVPVRTLSAVAAEFDFSRVRLVKIDVEGYESEVLSGALAWLTDSPPDAIVFESNATQKPGDPDPVLSLLSDRGYTFFAIPKALFSLKLVPYQLGQERTVASHDMLAVRKDCEREILAKFTILA